MLLVQRMMFGIHLPRLQILETFKLLLPQQVQGMETIQTLQLTLKRLPAGLVPPQYFLARQ